MPMGWANNYSILAEGEITEDSDSLTSGSEGVSDSMFSFSPTHLEFDFKDLGSNGESEYSLSHSELEE